MASTTTKCSRCRNAQQTHIVKTTGGFHRACGSCAEELVEVFGERVLGLTVIAGVTPAPAKPKPETSYANVAEEAAAVLPGNEFAAQITGLLVSTKAGQ